MSTLSNIHSLVWVDIWDKVGISVLQRVNLAIENSLTESELKKVVVKSRLREKYRNTAIPLLIDHMMAINEPND